MQQELSYNCILMHDNSKSDNQSLIVRNKCLSTITFNSDNFPNNVINIEKMKALVYRIISLVLINSFNL